MEPVENHPALPPKPLSAAKQKGPSQLLDSRSPLSVAFRHVRPNWRSYMLYVDMAARNGSREMTRYRDCYLGLAKGDRLNHWPEQLCELANVSPGELVGAVCRAIWEAKAAESSMVSSIALPEVLLQTAKLAQRPEHYRDRELVLRLTGLLPDKKGTSINIINNPMAQAGELSLSDARSAGARLKSFDEEIIEMSGQLDAPFAVKTDVPS